jgi:protein involved in polysaccharide export with SLBB domain
VTARRALAWLVCSLVLAAGPARAQGSLLDLLGAGGTNRPAAVTGASANPLANAPMSGPVDPAEYVVGPGDLLQVHLGGGVTRNWDVVVSPEGTLFVPSVGAIPVAGHSLLEVRKLVATRVGADYKGVAIDVSLTRPRVMLVNLVGQTRRQGALEVVATSRASEVLVDTLFDRHSSTRNIEIRRSTPQGQVRIPVDLTRFRLTGMPGRDPLLHDGDVLYVPVAKQNVSIEGAVGRPGFYELAPGDSLSTLLALAGGGLGESAEQATLVRFRDATHTDTVGFRVSDVVAGRFDLALRDGDHAFLYYEPGFHDLSRASILGEVRRPGTYPLPPGSMRFSALVAEAGGFLPGADLATMRVFRANPKAADPDPELERLAGLSRQEMTTSEYAVLRARLSVRREDFRVDWNRLQKEPELDMTLRDGDVVRVDRILPSVRVEGEVRRPGLIEFERGRKIEGYVKLAGGYSERAESNQVRVTRAVSGQTILGHDVDAIEPGDLVWVPERPEPRTWQNFQTLLLVMSQVAMVIVVVRHTP